MIKFVPRILCLSFILAPLVWTGSSVSWSAESEDSHSAEVAGESHGAAHVGAPSDEGHHGEETHAAGSAQGTEHGHGDHEGEHEEHPPEVPDFTLLIAHFFPSTSHFIHTWRVLFFSVFEAMILATVFIIVGKNLKKIPGRFQGFIELYVELIDNFVCGILGKEIGRVYVPFLGTLAIYILFMNLCGLIPGFMSPTAIPLQTFGLSICVFIYVQYTAFKFQGPKGYFFHLAGEPQDAIGYVLSPLFLVLHVMGELIKPVSLGLRLFGNILGEDILLGVFSMLGILLTQFILSFVGVEHVWLGIPLHFLLIPIALLGSTIQATVFMVLSTIYIYLVLPHHEGPEEHAHAGAH